MKQIELNIELRNKDAEKITKLEVRFPNQNVDCGLKLGIGFCLAQG